MTTSQWIAAVFLTLMSSGDAIRASKVRVKSVKYLAVLLTCVVLNGVQIAPAHAVLLFPEIVDTSGPWLFIGTGAPNDSTTPEGTFNKGVGDAVDISNFEIGAIKSPVPANEFGNQSPTSYGPGLQWFSNVPSVPGVVLNQAPFGINVDPFGFAGLLPPEQIIDYSGNVAVTHIDDDDPSGDKNGRFGVSNVGVFAKNLSDGGKIPDGLPAGIVTAGPANTDAGFARPSVRSRFVTERSSRPFVTLASRSSRRTTTTSSST